MEDESAESVSGDIGRPSTKDTRQQEADLRGRYHDWGSSIYLSNDDTMSLSSAQRIIYAIDNYRPLPPEHIRPHELLNYFSFQSPSVSSGHDFGVLAQLEEKPGETGKYSLGLSISGREATRESRRNTALTLVLDRSGSMSDEGRMAFLKRGLRRMLSELKDGDLVNMALFNQSVCVPLENFVVGRDPMHILTSAIERLSPGGSTNLEAGLRRGYELADVSYQGPYSNRVVLITDAQTNTGVTNEEMISLISERYDQKRIRLSGVGVGSDFNDKLLDRLTERGKGAYVFLGSGAEVDAVFGARFPALIETIANDVHFQLHLPPSLAMDVFYGEESSTVKRDVQAIHYFAGTNQMFLSDLTGKNAELNRRDSLMLTIEYRDPETNAPLVEEYAFRLGDIENLGHNVRKGRLLMSFVDGLSDIARRGRPTSTRYHRGGWLDSEASEQCSRGRESLSLQAGQLPPDPEVDRVLGLWSTFCDRYQGFSRSVIHRRPLPPPTQEAVPESDPRRPYRRVPPTGGDVWPSASR